MSELELVRQYFPKASPVDAHEVLYEATCYPIGSLSEVRKQLQSLADEARPRKRGWQRRLNRAYARIDAELIAACRAIEAGSAVQP